MAITKLGRVRQGEVKAIGRSGNTLYPKLHRALRRNRAGVVALVIAGALVAALSGIGGADEGDWRSHTPGDGAFADGPLPGGRFGAATAWEGNNNEILMFGGFTAASEGATPVPSYETWGMGTKRRNQRWQNRVPIHHPSARGYASMAYDEARKKMVLFGGAPYRSKAVSGETWTYDGSDWTLLDPPGPRPPARQKASMVYDAHRKVVVMFGGLNVSGDSINNGVLVGVPPNAYYGGDTWIWNGSSWKEIKPVSSPRQRHSAAMTYDICRGEAILFGGIQTAGNNSEGSSGPGGNETWAWNGETWTQKSPVITVNETTKVVDPSRSPTARIGASMAYSYATGKVLLYGGLTVQGVLSFGNVPMATDENVWSWDGSAWEKGTYDLFGPFANANGTPSGAGSLPQPRGYASFGYDGKNTDRVGATYHISLFGGTPTGDWPLAVGGGSGGPDGLIRNAMPQVVLRDQFYFTEGGLTAAAPGILRLGEPVGCVDPVPLPAEGVLAGGDSAPSVKEEVRNEIREIARLPVLLGTDPRTVPAGAPNPACLRRKGKEGTGNTHLMTDSKRNRVYQFFLCDPEAAGGGFSGNRVLIQAYDGTTLKPLGSAIAPIPFFTVGKGGLPVPVTPLHDAERGRFLIPLPSERTVWVIQQDLIEKGVNPVVDKITLPSKSYRKDALSPLADIVLPGQSLTKTERRVFDVGFFNHPKTDRAKFLISYEGENPLGGTVTNNSNPSSTPVEIVQWDPLSNSVDWSSGVDGCEVSVAGVPTAAIRFKDMVLSSCVISVSNAIPNSAVVRIPIVEDLTAPAGETAAPPEMFPGLQTVAGTWADPAAERMLILTTRVSPDGRVMWVFDGKSSRYVGRVGVANSLTNGAMGTGFDPETGRFYFLMKDYRPHQTVGSGAVANMKRGGLFVTDTRLTPAPQAINFAQFSYPAGAEIGVLPPGAGLPTRVFVRRAGGFTPSDPSDQEQVEATADQVDTYPDGEKIKVPDEMYYKVLADEFPVPQPPLLEQQDALTVPVAESPGKTEVSFDAEASGYGLRLRKVGGTLFVGQSDSPCFGTDRELLAGWVANAHLSDLVTSARSLGLEADPSSKLDLGSPISRCNVPKTAVNPPDAAKQTFDDVLWPAIVTSTAQIDAAAGSGEAEAAGQKVTLPTSLAWDKHFNEVECVGDSSNTTQTAAAGVYESATCKQTEGRVEGAARGSALGFSYDQNSFSVGEANSNVVVARDPARGVVVTSTAVAKGIQIGPLSIERVETKAVSWSNGRPGEDRTSFTRYICGVHDPEGRIPNGCLSSSQQKQFLDGLNQLLSRMTAKATFPEPDPNYLRGTPGGFTAGITKPLTEATEDQFFTRDDQQEVPALRIAFNREQVPIGPGPLILELAGVRAVTSYGVQCDSDRIYSPQASDCVAIDFGDDEFEEEEFVEEEEVIFEDESELDGEWTPEALVDSPESLGSRIGKLLDQLPVFSQIPLRQMGEALLLGSVWLLLGAPLVLAGRRLTMDLNIRGGN